MRPLSRSLSQGSAWCLQTSQGRQCTDTWEEVSLLRHPTRTLVLSSFGLRGVIVSADQDRDSEGTKELSTYSHATREATQKRDTQASGLQAQGSLYHNIF